MMRFISYCSSKCYENTDGQPGGHRSQRGRGPRMAWPPSAVLEGGAHKRSAVGRIAPKGRTSRGPLPAGDCPTGESEPFRPDTLQRHPAVTCGRTETAESVLAQGRQDLRENEKRQKCSCAGSASPAKERKRGISFFGRSDCATNNLTPATPAPEMSWRKKGRPG